MPNNQLANHAIALQNLRQIKVVKKNSQPKRIEQIWHIGIRTVGHLG